MIIKTTKNIFNFLRYLSAFLVIFIIFYTPSLVIDKSFINEAIQSKVPFQKKKKNHEIYIESFDISKIENKIVHLRIKGKLRYKKKLCKIKISKKFKFIVEGTVIPILEGSTLSFQLKHLKVKRIIGDKIIKSVLKNKIKKTKITIKQLKKINDLAVIKNIEFLDNGDLLVNYKLTNWLLLLVVMFLIFETKYILLISKKQRTKARKKKKNKQYMGSANILKDRLNNKDNS